MAARSFDAGEWDRADEVLTEAIRAGTETGDRRLAADASVALAQLRIHQESDASHERIRAELDDAIRVFTEFGDRAALARALGFAGQLRFWSGDATGAIAELSAAAEHARAAGDHVEKEDMLRLTSSSRRRTDRSRSPRDFVAAGNCETPTEATADAKRSILRCEARFASYQGNFELARERIAD